MRRRRRKKSGVDGLIKKRGRDMECRLRGTDHLNKEAGREENMNNTR